MYWLLAELKEIIIFQNISSYSLTSLRLMHGTRSDYDLETDVRLYSIEQKPQEELLVVSLSNFN